MKSTLVAALMLVPVLGLAACGGDDSSEPQAPVSGASDPTSPPPPSESGVITPSEVPEIPEFKGKPAGIIGDTETTECTTEPGPVTAKGTVTNTAPGPLPRDIAISMSWTTVSGSDVVARGVERLPAVPPGETRDWEVTATLDATEPVQCVPTALRGQFKTAG